MNQSSNTWGISGPTFLALYFAGIVLTIVAVVVIRRRESRRFGAPDVDLAGLDPYDVALLRGSRGHAANVALVSLLHSGTVVLKPNDAARPKRWYRPADPTDVLETAAPCPDAAHPIEQDLCGRVRDHDGAAVAQTVVLETAESDAMVETERTLVERGLEYDDETMRRLQTSTLLAWVPIVVLGVARLIAGLQNDRPVGFLVLMLFAVGYAVVFTFAASSLKESPGRRNHRVPHVVFQRLGEEDRGALEAVAADVFGGTRTIAPSAETTRLALLGLALYGTKLVKDDNSLVAASGITAYSVSWLAYAGYMGGGGGGGCGGGGCGGGGCGG